MTLYWKVVDNFKQKMLLSRRLTAEELLEKELPLKFVEVDEEQSRLVLSNRNAMADSQAQLGIGSVFTGTVQSLKPYGTFIDIGGINGLLHFCQISHDRVTDIATVFQPGDTLKVMILSHDRERGCISLSTKKLEPTPGEVIRNLKLDFKKVYFKERISSLLLATYVACHCGGYGSNIRAEILNPSLSKKRSSSKEFKGTEIQRKNKDWKCHLLQLLTKEY